MEKTESCVPHFALCILHLEEFDLKPLAKEHSCSKKTELCDKGAQFETTNFNLRNFKTT